MDKKSQVSQVTLSAEDSFIPVIVSSDTVTPIQSLKNAVPEQLVTIKAKVHSLIGTKKIFTRDKTELLKQDGILVDPTGQINIVLWQDQVDSLQEGHTYIFKHIKVKDDQYGERYVNPPKNNAEYSVEPTSNYEENLPDVQLLPDTTIQVPASICGVRDVTVFKACFSCGNRIIEKNGKGNCPKCHMSVKVNMCSTQCYLKLILMTPDSKVIQLSVFNKELLLLASLAQLHDIDSCNQDMIEDALLTLDKLNITYDSVTKKLLHVEL